jgi:hypothetical protein
LPDSSTELADSANFQLPSARLDLAQRSQPETVSPTSRVAGGPTTLQSTAIPHRSITLINAEVVGKQDERQFDMPPGNRRLVVAPARALGYAAVKKLLLWHCGGIIDCSAARQNKMADNPPFRGCRRDAPCFPLPLFTAVDAETRPPDHTGSAVPGVTRHHAGLTVH